MNRTHFVRLIEIDKLIRANHYPNCLYLQKVLNVSERTVLRDIDTLKTQFGAPLRYSKRHNGYYYKDEQFSLKELQLTEGELMWYLIGRNLMEAYKETPFFDEIEKAYTKMSYLLPDYVNVQQEEAGAISMDLYNSYAVKKTELKIFKTLLDAIEHNSKIKIEYLNIFEQPKVTRDTIHPYKLIFHNGTWLVKALCESVHQIKRLHLKQIKRIRKLKDSFIPPENISKSENRWPHQHHAERHLIKARFDKAVTDIVAEKLNSHKKSMIKDVSGDLIAEFYTHDLEFIYHWLLSFGPQVEILEPLSLRKKIRKDLVSMITTY